MPPRDRRTLAERRLADLMAQSTHAHRVDPVILRAFRAHARLRRIALAVAAVATALVLVSVGSASLDP